MVAVGAALLVTAELADRLEVDLGLDALNLILASMFAALGVSVAALAGDSLIAAIAKRSGRRPDRRIVTALLMLAGAVATGWIVIGHLSHPLRLDGWLGLAGSVLLMLSALAYRQLPPAPRPEP